MKLLIHQKFIAGMFGADLSQVSDPGSEDPVISKLCFRNTSRVSNCTNPDKAQLAVVSDLDSNCLQRLS